MTQSSDPDRIYVARRTALVTRLVGLGRISSLSAERWVAQWETEATLRGLDRQTIAFWGPAWDWIAWRRGR
jgi:hypothetical protein